ncbi:choice-of-anchor C family protein [Crocinitomicaceae bacterium]|nr:choice-of-anchor C family protein [Crocinitomicaceae bacterium]
MKQQSMKNKTRFHGAKRIFISALVVVGWSNSYASIITNGSFESASVDPGTTWIALSPGDTSIAGWTVINDLIHYMGTYWVASDGIRSVDLDGATGQAGGIEQQFATVAGNKYEVSFDMSGNLAGGPTIKPMQVIADGQIGDFTFDITGISQADMGWINHKWLFTADDALATLQFVSINSPASFGPVIDNVSVRMAPMGQTPEPAVLALFSIGLAGIGYHRRRKAKTA